MYYLPLLEIVETHTYKNGHVTQDSHPGGLRPDRALYKVV